MGLQGGLATDEGGFKTRWNPSGGDTTSPNRARTRRTSCFGRVSPLAPAWGAGKTLTKLEIK